MSKIYVAEFPGTGGTDQGDSVPLFPVPPLAEQNVTVSSVAVNIANAFQPATVWVEVSTDTTCSISWGPLATITTATATSNCRLAPNERIARRVPKGQAYGISVISNT
jgi:hypothetical protein